MEDSLEAQRAKRRQDEQERQKRDREKYKPRLGCGFRIGFGFIGLISIVLVVWLCSSLINGCSRRNNPPIVSVRENDAFSNPSGFGHLFISIEHSDAKDAPLDDQGLHVQIGYLAPTASAQSIWIGSRSERIDKHDYPSLSADILVFKITTLEDGKHISDIMKSAAEKYSHKELWTWDLHKGDGVKNGNCVQFARMLLEKMEVIGWTNDEAGIDEWRRSLITGTQLKEILLDQSFTEPAQAIVDEVNTTSDPQKKLRRREKLATWDKVRQMWDANQKRKK